MEFRKDMAWFQRFLPRFNGVFLIHKDTRVPTPLYMDVCTSSCGAVTNTEAYHVEFPPHIVRQRLSICHLEALNAVVAVKVWVLNFTEQLVHLFSGTSTAVAIFQAGKGKDPFIQACAREIWLVCTAWDVTLAVDQVCGASLSDTADALSHWHLGQSYKDKVEALFIDNGITRINAPDELFQLSNNL